MLRSVMSIMYLLHDEQLMFSILPILYLITMQNGVCWYWKGSQTFSRLYDADSKPSGLTFLSVQHSISLQVIIYQFKIEFLWVLIKMFVFLTLNAAIKNIVPLLEAKLSTHIQDEGPFTAFGFFDVDKTTLRATLATVVTYLIILIQFNLC